MLMKMENPFLNKDRASYCVLYIVRHGLTDWNMSKRFQGQIDIPLNETGKDQARLAGKRFENIHFDVAFSSDLIRAKQTAELMLLEKKIAVATTKALRERAFGPLEGKTMEELEEEVRENVEKFFSQSYKENMGFRPYPGFETNDELMGRVFTFLRETAVGYKGKTALLVSHGGLMRALLLHLGYGTNDKLRSRSIMNTAHIKLLCDGIDFYIEETVGIGEPIVF